MHNKQTTFVKLHFEIPVVWRGFKRAAVCGRQLCSAPHAPRVRFEGVAARFQQAALTLEIQVFQRTALIWNGYRKIKGKG